MSSSSAPNHGKILKRQRVSAACQKCRQLKAKCDGARPRCERCRAYSYECIWMDGKRVRRNEEQHQSPTTTNLSDLLESSTLNRAIDLLHPLLLFVRPLLSSTDEQKLQQIWQRIGDHSLYNQTAPSLSTRSENISDVTQTYLGEASEGDFIRSIKRGFGESEADNIDPISVDRSYIQDNIPLPTVNTLSLSSISKDEGMRYMGIFSSTIGIAYPFIPLDQLEQAICQTTENTQTDTLSDNWQSLVLAVFAIGACYIRLSSDDPNPTSAPTNTKDRQLFHQSFQLTALARHDHARNIERVWARLTHCFYLLATSQIDRCWTSLGQVVRLAHGIGLHVEKPNSSSQDIEDIESGQRRTTWYCIFILDHLLALQLGRPPAVYTPFFSVRIPTNVMAQQNSNPPSGVIDIQLHSKDAIRDYLIAMVNLSNVVEEVMQTLYTPRDTTVADRSAIIARLDHKLLCWKAALPRRLRFDLGHAFETSSIHKRHRNFLAMKYYHLRAIIHRPFLSYLKRSTAATRGIVSMTALSSEVRFSVTTCIESAQCTARLLYDIKNKEDVVHNFPWWQMISCLTCASSILLVAIMDRELSANADAQAIQEDVDICLKVFKALSINSKAAEAALDLMNKLRATAGGLRSESTIVTSSHDTGFDSTQPFLPVENRLVVDNSNLTLPTVDGADAGSGGVHAPFATTQVDYNVLDFDPDFFGIDNSMSDSLMWSTQFISNEFYPQPDETDQRGR